ncbi:nuclease [Bacillus sp. AFS076308]|uniref:nuclease-related domain-containing protein n=1 Tax=unclassified Bacillus (in: firmicutes) TaxID=185979 RepID=UPI000BF4B48A|nr:MULTISPECIES: nuclease-related domain-containing protein [unclassified Bacillus (in: firmicutes)]PFN79515.1 nuclease [Bacillus sp. AFS076308]PGV48929.1 nuclease [Bacillus sp. AFS037270]
MAYKPRSVPEDLKALRILNNRMDLTSEQQKYYLYKEKGFEGEVQFDLLTEQLQSDCLILNDLNLEINNTSFQLDTSIIFQETFYFFEVKNYEGDYCYREERFETNFGKIIKNPLDQIKRSNSLLLQLFQNLGFSQSIDACVVFVNPEFFLYQAPMDKPIFYPPQLKQLMRKLDNEPSKLTYRHKKIADKLISLHQVKSPYSNLNIPAYNYNQLRRDITCSVCHSFSCSVSSGIVVCDDCGHVESVESAVLRCVEEIRLLFPSMRITTNGVFEWCGIIDSRKSIRRILKKNFKSIGDRNLRYFE